jgi:hypothetical protein
VTRRVLQPNETNKQGKLVDRISRRVVKTGRADEQEKGGIDGDVADRPHTAVHLPCAWPCQVRHTAGSVHHSGHWSGVKVYCSARVHAAGLISLPGVRVREHCACHCARRKSKSSRPVPGLRSIHRLPPTCCLFGARHLFRLPAGAGTGGGGSGWSEKAGRVPADGAGAPSSMRALPRNNMYYHAALPFIYVCVST